MTGKTSIGRFARIAVSIVLLGALVFHVGPRVVVEQLGGMDRSLVALAFVLLLAEALVRALNWFQLIRSGAPNVPLASVAYAHFVGGFFGALLPSTLGTDMARSAVVTARSKISIEAAFATTVLLNLLSLAVISAAALAACTVAFDWPDAPRATLAASVAASGACLLAVFLLWLKAIAGRSPGTSDGAASGGARGRLKRRFAQFLTALLVLPRGSRLAGVTVVAALSYVLRSLGWLALLIAAGAGVPWTALLTIAPLVTLGAALPISVLGFGGFQAISVWLLVQWGVAAGEALAASLVQSALAVLLHAIGGIAYAAGDRGSAPALGIRDPAKERYPG